MCRFWRIRQSTLRPLGPFRDAVESTAGDRKTHQRDGEPCECLLEVRAGSLEEGADMVMVKPAGSATWILCVVAEFSPVPVAAYQVSI